MVNCMAPAGTGKRVSLTVLGQQEKEAIGGFSMPSKMPWLSWSISAEKCRIGSRLAEVPGSVCYGCYALKGNYAWPDVKRAHTRRFATLTNLVEWTADMVRFITERASRYMPTEDEPLPSFRWHDAGDLQGVFHLMAIIRVAQKTQDVVLGDGSIGDVAYWLPTREYGDVETVLGWGVKIPHNLVVRLSAHMIDGPVPSGYGLPVSSVHTDTAVYPDAYQCPAYTQGGKCRSCRACWDRTVKHVSYPKH